jgi:hypothetical protein
MHAFNVKVIAYIWNSYGDLANFLKGDHGALDNRSLCNEEGTGKDTTFQGFLALNIFLKLGSRVNCRNEYFFRRYWGRKDIAVFASPVPRTSNGTIIDFVSHFAG